jgi:hypothetical protein
MSQSFAQNYSQDIEFDGYNTSMVKSSHFQPYYREHLYPHPTQQEIGILYEYNHIVEKDMDPKRYYPGDKNYPHDAWRYKHGEVDEKIEEVDAMYVKMTVKHVKLTENHKTAPLKVWTKELRGIDKVFLKEIFKNSDPRHARCFLAFDLKTITVHTMG